MKKRIICFVTVIFLTLSVSVNVCAADVEDNNENADISVENEQSVPGESGMQSQNIMSELSPDISLQLTLAKLQLEQTKICNQQAMVRMEQIAKTQEEQKLVCDFLNTARQCSADAKSTGKATQMPSDMAEYMNTNGLAYDTTGNDLLMTSEEWDTAIGSLEIRLEELGKNTQQQMVYVQDYMGQYNSYLQGENTQISNSNQMMTSLARGQSMYGDSEAGLTVPALVVGLTLGCVITLAVQKVRRKKSVE